jgi:hypothetical protein
MQANRHQEAHAASCRHRVVISIYKTGLSHGVEHTAGRRAASFPIRIALGRRERETQDREGKDNFWGWPERGNGTCPIQLLLDATPVQIRKRHVQTPLHP